jgi:hypothetical protein
MHFKGLLTGTLLAGAVTAALAAAAPGEALGVKHLALGPDPRPTKTTPGTKGLLPRPNAQGLTPTPPTPEALEFFETKVRPVLAESCYSCHGPKLQQAGLRLDSLAALLKGTDAGHPGIVPGDPDRSALIQAIRYNGAVKMPPAGKLPQASIDALATWVKMGAPWPSISGAPTPNTQRPTPAKHWAFQPVVKPKLPVVKAKTRVRTPVDALVLARLEKKGLTLSPQADRRTLIRRATFDLTGLPPTAEEVEAFVKDPSADAWEKVIDRLLASPRYGERWGRYWLDVARYADSKGYVFQEERNYPYSYTYRDWVVRAFNEDLPYDQFLISQLAADQLDLKQDKSPLAAMGFLTLGRRFLNNQPDIIDDRMDVVFRGTQALTVGCARCHDHKFDPIPTKDYYSLYGVFASSVEPAGRELPVLAPAERTAEYETYEKELRKLEGELERFRDAKVAEAMQRARQKLAESMLAAREAAASDGRGELRALAQKWDVPFVLIARWRDFLRESAKDHHPIFAAWQRFAALPDSEFAAKAPALAKELAANADPQRRLNPAIAKLFEGPPPASLQEVAKRYQAVLTAPSSDQQIQHALDSIDGPLDIPKPQRGQLLNRDERNQLQALQQKVDKLMASSPAAPPRAMVLVDSPRPMTPRVFRRGNPNNPGEEVQRHFLTVLSGPEPKPFQKGSGRLELAQAIASKSNPLTARVMVNRVWTGHFGAPLVRTPSDFGVRSEPPANPELLDYLAAQFMEDGWSLKKLHRLIMLSSVYQQGSDLNPKAAHVDPENFLLWRVNRRRLDFEAIRDSILFATGALDLTLGGKAVLITTAPFSTRRTIYGYIDRQNLPGLFRVFDFASPDAHSPQRFVTTVPQQALFMMNSPFMVEQARKLAARTKDAADPKVRIRQLYRLAYAREATADEIALGLRFVEPKPGSTGTIALTSTAPPASGTALTPWERYAQVLLMSNEFLFVD